MSYFYLNEDHSVRECDLCEWSEQFEQMSLSKQRHIAEDLIDGKIVSTVWLGLNHNYFGGVPLIFETMIFESEDSGSDIFCDRYSTWDEAVEGHKKAMQWVKDVCKDKD
jgi:hypothetical protein